MREDGPMRSTRWQCAAVTAVVCQTAALGGLCWADSPDAAPPQHDPQPDLPHPIVVVVRLENEAITPITARFVGRAIDDAASAGAECLVILLDTPGGLVDSTRRMVKAILASPVPVVVFVAPQGARAASAGMFITMAAHVAAMAPGTNIGAAAPVSLGGDLPFVPPNRPADSDDPEEGDRRGPAAGDLKAINDTVAWARALASLHGRDVEWATQAVRESVSVPATEAIEAGAVDLLADDLNDLLHRIDGRIVSTPDGPRTLRTAEATIIERPTAVGRTGTVGAGQPTRGVSAPRARNLWRAL